MQSTQISRNKIRDISNSLNTGYGFIDANLGVAITSSSEISDEVVINC